MSRGPRSARTIAENLGGGKAHAAPVTTVPSFVAGGVRTLAVGGRLLEPLAPAGPGHPADRPVRWALTRRAEAGAVRAHAGRAERLCLATGDDEDGELIALQVARVAGSVSSGLRRRARRLAEDGTGEGRRLEEAPAHARELRLEYECLVAQVVGPGLGPAEAVALCAVRDGLRRLDGLGVPASTLHRLRETGLVAVEPLAATPAGRALAARLGRVAPALSDPDLLRDFSRLDAAVRDGCLDHDRALHRARDLLRQAAPHAGSDTAALGDGRVLGACPGCGGPMSVQTTARGRRRLACARAGCAASPLPSWGLVLAVPDRTCGTCGMPLIRVVDGGRRGPARCPNRPACPGAPPGR